MKNTSKNSRNTQTQSKFYSLGVVETDGVFKVVDSYLLQKLNQYKQNWRKVDSREVARNMNRGKLVIK